MELRHPRVPLCSGCSCSSADAPAPSTLPSAPAEEPAEGEVGFISVSVECKDVAATLASLATVCGSTRVCIACRADAAIDAADLAGSEAVRDPDGRLVRLVPLLPPGERDGKHSGTSRL
jgi:hypothetical protein